MPEPPPALVACCSWSRRVTLPVEVDPDGSSGSGSLGLLQEFLQQLLVEVSS